MKTRTFVPIGLVTVGVMLVATIVYSQVFAIGDLYAVPDPCFNAEVWPEADRLFHQDPHWVGGDAASSVDLGDGRILWLFGDSWIDSTESAVRSGSRMVSNTVAIQTGTNPETAAIRFYSGHGTDGSPTAFIPDAEGVRHWFGNGIRIDERLILFLGRVRTVDTGLGFEAAGWTAVMVENPDDEPPDWRLSRLDAPTNPLGVAVGFAGTRLMGAYAYAFGSQDPVKSHPVFAVRWPVDEAEAGHLMEPEWWAGDTAGWVPDSTDTPRWPLFENGQSELSIHRDAASQHFVSVHTLGFGAASVVIRHAPALTGPWTHPELLYRPPEQNFPNVIIYSAKAHPELTGADLAVTYNTNSFDFAEMVNNPALYFPRFVRLTRCTSG